MDLKEVQIFLKFIFKKSDFNTIKKKNNSEIFFVWNHRWEDDKNPKDFFRFLRLLKKEKTILNSLFWEKKQITRNLKKQS